jgi:energy-coupling factor transporter ATP-binding protein EcfA2
MITKLTVESFKTLEKVEIELGLVNVFVGANGSGKSNLLEAVGVLSAAADGKVNDQVLLQHGVRPGLPQLYKSAFSEHLPQHIFFGAQNDKSSYEVSLYNPMTDSKPWRYKTESWKQGGKTLASRSPAMAENPNTEVGLANARAIEMQPGSPGLNLLKQLQDYVVFSPTTPVLRGTAPETQPRRPVGLHGGRLPDAVGELLMRAARNKHAAKVCEEALSLIDWAKDFRSESAEKVPISPAAGASPRVIRFVDRYMREGRNVLSGYDASEGALYVLFLAVLAAHESSPRFCAVDNADHGLNPRLAKALVFHLCQWILESPQPVQILLTAHNPQVLDGLRLQEDDVRLFTVSRTSKGRSSIRRVEVTPEMKEKANKDGWTLSRLWVMGHLGGVPDV